MNTDANAIPRFYEGRAGTAACRILRGHLAGMWPDMRRLDLLGVGFVEPYLGLWRADAASAVARPLGDGIDAPDLSADRILLVHALERAADRQRLLRECWRVLRDDGRLIVVVPNRIGLWAHLETTPFGEGQPYTQGQVTELFRTAMFAIESHRHALFVPPVGWSKLWRLAPLAERIGRGIAPRIGGVIVAEAVKDVYAPAPLMPVSRRRIIPSPSLGMMRAA